MLPSMRALLLAALLLFLTPAAAASAASVWTADDASGDADPSVANEWADLLHGELGAADGLRLTLTVAKVDPVPPAGTAYLAAYDGDGGPRFCAMVQDRPDFLKFFVGGWDPASHAATDAEETRGEFVPGSPATIRADCGDGAPSAVSFEVVDIKPYLLPHPMGIVLDAADAAASETDPAPPATPPQPAASLPKESPGLGAAAPLAVVGLALILRRRVA
jgi:uncharacterized protein (TIGR03382 family)